MAQKDTAQNNMAGCTGLTEGYTFAQFKYAFGTMWYAKQAAACVPVLAYAAGMQASTLLKTQRGDSQETLRTLRYQILDLVDRRRKPARCQCASVFSPHERDKTRLAVLRAGGFDGDFLPPTFRSLSVSGPGSTYRKGCVG